MKIGKSIAILCMIGTLFVSASAELPLSINAKSGWEVEFEGGGIAFFTLTRSDNNNVLLMFSRSPLPVDGVDISEFVKDTSDAILKAFKSAGDTTEFPQSYKIEKIKGVEFSGKVAVFESRENFQQCVFMISDGKEIWGGQYTGASELWEEAKSILQKLTRG